jgi:hypothetical protein
LQGNIQNLAQNFRQPLDLQQNLHPLNHVAQQTGASEIQIADQTHCQASRADLGARTKKNGLPLFGTKNKPKAR